MSEHTLIATVGRSPGAVTGAVRALQKVNIPIKHVVLLGTGHSKVVASARWVERLLSEIGIHCTVNLLPNKQSDLRARDESANAFVVLAGQALQTAHAAEHTVHVAVTGGRAGMGALAALAAGLYGADHLWYLWVEDAIAEKGDIDRLPSDADLAHECLDPTQNDAWWDLVALPFVDLRPLHPVLWDYQRNRVLPPEGTPLLKLLAQKELERLADVFPATFPMRYASRVLRLSENSPASLQAQLAAWEELQAALKQYNVMSEELVEQVPTLIRMRKRPADFLRLADSEGDIDDFIPWLRRNQDSIVRRYNGQNRGIPPSLRQAIRDGLLECGDCHSPDTVRNRFSDDRIFPWRHNVPLHANNVHSYAIALICTFYTTFSRNGENALVLLLEVLAEDKAEGDGCRARLLQLAGELNRQVARSDYVPVDELFPFLMQGLERWLIYRGVL